GGLLQGARGEAGPSERGRGRRGDREGEPGLALARRRRGHHGSRPQGKGRVRRGHRAGLRGPGLHSRDARGRPGKGPRGGPLPRAPVLLLPRRGRAAGLRGSPWV
ncbi:MAG: hypothetical protein AVDCRST_MAG01-01-1331, partial [uncultured Rubrobacteraceae bacterium]